jgi:undecaprenyl diphosphate synthase
MLKHLACIMDGNRRWAIQHGLMAFVGHKFGWDAVKRVIDFCCEKNISYVSLYTFSIENLQRSEEEKHYLFEVLAQEAFKELDNLKHRNIRVCFVGNRTLFPQSIKVLCENSEQETKHCTGLRINFCLCYGAQQEIADTAQRIAIEVTQGNLSPENITSETFEKYLWTSGTPSPDLIIRTGGDRRLSNFLLFQSAYSELFFSDVLWPDISSAELESALIYFDKCRRNFGK